MTTPPSLDGMHRRIAYANRKYHSGLMWVGVDVILAWLKFSGSPIISGFVDSTNLKIIDVIIIGVRSFVIKYGMNFILSVFVVLPDGLEDPDLCSNSRWIKITVVIINGRRKCSESIRFRVGWETE